MPHPKDLSRRAFLQRAGGAAVAVPSIAAILAACRSPPRRAGGGGSTGTEAIPIADAREPGHAPP